MPAGAKLIAQVAGLLSPNTGKRTAEICAGITLGASPRAIRYAITELEKTGKAIRKGPMLFAAADLSVIILQNRGGTELFCAVPLLECFPDDPDGYQAAKADLLRDGSHRGGGGAAAEYHLKLAEAA